MRDELIGKTPEQLAAEGHWNGDEVESAHERLFDLVEHYRTLRGIALAQAIKVVHEDLEAGRLAVELRLCVDVYRRWRAGLQGTGGVTTGVTLDEFRVWMETGQFGGASPPDRVGSVVIKLQTPERQAAFAAVMVRMDQMRQEGLSVGRAAGRLVNEAMLSSQVAPCETRRMLQQAMRRRGVDVVGVDQAHGLPSIDTVCKWYLRHRTGAVKQVDAGLAVVKGPRQWVSRKAHWHRAAQQIKAANPAATALQVYAALIERWRDWWGSPVSRADYLADVERGLFKT